MYKEKEETNTKKRKNIRLAILKFSTLFGILRLSLMERSEDIENKM